MAYYIDLFSPETYLAFANSEKNISGFRENRKSVASLIGPGDKLICYMTKLSRWVGVLEVASPYFIDGTPLFTRPTDPFTVRFKVIPRVWLQPEESVPIGEDICWNALSFTKTLPRTSHAWTGMVRSSLMRLSDGDGRWLEELLMRQGQSPTIYPLSEKEARKMRSSLVNGSGGQVAVSIPDNDVQTDGVDAPAQLEQAESIRVQAMLAEIGERMNTKVWIPRADRQRVLRHWRPASAATLLDRLPLNYDDVTLRTIENIDVLWIRRHSVVRAFEVEHTTSIYSGILRMADLMALQPNLSIKAHIVAPMERRNKVLQEIARPVFALLERGPLSESCSYLSYDAVAGLLAERNLSFLSDEVLDSYAEYAQDAEL